MTKINWKVRVRNVRFWLSIVPMILLFVEQVAALCGYKLDLGELSNHLKGIIETLFVILGFIGIVNDPTTATFADSENAMTYEWPKNDSNIKED